MCDEQKREAWPLAGEAAGGGRLTSSRLWSYRSEGERRKPSRWAQEGQPHGGGGGGACGFNTRRPLATLVGVVSAEWGPQKQDQGGPRRAWKARLERGGPSTEFSSGSLGGGRVREKVVAGRRETWASQAFGFPTCKCKRF